MLIRIQLHYLGYLGNDFDVLLKQRLGGNVLRSFSSDFRHVIPLRLLLFFGLFYKIINIFFYISEINMHMDLAQLTFFSFYIKTLKIKVQNGN